MEILLWIGFIVGFVLSAAALIRGKGIGSNSLALLMLVVSMLFLGSSSMDVLKSLDWKTALGFTLASTVGPLMLLTIKYRFRNTGVFQGRDYLHFTIPMIFLFILLVQVLLNSPDFNYYLMLAELLFYEIVFIQMLVYLSYSFILLRKLHSADTQKSIQLPQIMILTRLVLALIALLLSGVIGFHLNSFTSVAKAHEIYSISLFSGLFLLLILGMYYFLSTRNWKVDEV